ncbi:hypothetical protein L2E82_14970 [Cichorium intybus]|uniref:Uncharacterized protein n=1 Tax=Cichorium intybus TaxID=13427 RepID=A0ACB9F2R4_CICIN|nr:hypothetical protein L2E82_14970 [Cichorium intybus]
MVRAGKHQVVFLVKGPISERYESLRGQLELLYGQEPATFLHAYTCLQLAYTTRQPAGAILQDAAWVSAPWFLSIFMNMLPWESG